MLSFRGLLLPALLAYSGLIGHDADIFGRAYGPKGRLLNSRPTLTWEIWSSDADEIVSAKAKVGAQLLAGRYDPVLKRALVDLNEPLSLGPHHIQIYAVLRNGQAVSKEWDVDVLPEALGELPASDASQGRALQAANRFRATLGFPAMRMDDRLNLASFLHCRYHAANNSTGHFETPGKPNFIANQPGERCEMVGWVGDCWETVEYGSSTEDEAIQNLIDAPYHRLPFIQPGELLFGSGFAKNRLTASFSMSADTALVLYPFNRQQGVPTQWSYNERPNPLRLYPDLKRPVGYPIMLAYFSKDTLRLNVRSALLKDAQGAEVPSVLNTASNDEELKNALILIPKKPLMPDTMYTVRVEASVENGPDVSRTWSFRTAARPAALALR